MSQGKVATTFNLPLEHKKALLEQARKENVPMTDLVIRWIEQNCKLEVGK